MEEQKFYIVRGDHSGVFFGQIAERTGKEVKLSNARCLWYWDGAASVIQLAAEGVTKPGNCKFTMTVPELEITDAIELIPCTDKAVACIKGVPAWKR